MNRFRIDVFTVVTFEQGVSELPDGSTLNRSFVAATTRNCHLPFADYRQPRRQCAPVVVFKLRIFGSIFHLIVNQLFFRQLLSNDMAQNDDARETGIL